MGTDENEQARQRNGGGVDRVVTLVTTFLATFMRNQGYERIKDKGLSGRHATMLFRA